MPRYGQGKTSDEVRVGVRVPTEESSVDNLPTLCLPPAVLFVIPVQPPRFVSLTFPNINFEQSGNLGNVLLTTQ